MSGEFQLDGERGVTAQQEDHPPPIERSYFSSSEYESPTAYFTSKERLPVMRMEHDWSSAKRNMRMVLLAIFTMAVMITEQELVFDRETRLFKVGTLVPTVLKGCISFLTMIQLWLLYDYYQYQIAGHKKEWYTALYVNRPCPPGQGELILFLYYLILFDS